MQNIACRVDSYLDATLRADFHISDLHDLRGLWCSTSGHITLVIPSYTLIFALSMGEQRAIMYLFIVLVGASVTVVTATITVAIDKQIGLDVLNNTYPALVAASGSVVDIMCVSLFC